MSFTYVIPDLHGRLDLLDAALQILSSRASSGSDRIVFLGDYVDKGPDSRGVIDRVRALDVVGPRVVTLKGNHDAMMAAALRGQIPMAVWEGRGGSAALESYGGSAKAVPIEHVDWLESRALYYCDEYRIYVHAGLAPGIALNSQTEEIMLWKRYADGDLDEFAGRHVVHGHDNRPDGPILGAGRTNLDSGAWRTGRLVLGVFDGDAPGGPVEIIEVIVDRI